METRGKSVSAAMRDAGYDDTTAKNPKNLTESRAWKDLMAEYLNDEKLSKKHDELLGSTKIEHMIFPLGPKGEDDVNLSGASSNQNDNEVDGDADPEAGMHEEHKERTTLTDEQIIGMLAEVNCTVRRIVHGQTARHVYYWVADNKARKDALDMAYKLKGHYAPEKKDVTVDVNSFNEYSNDDLDRIAKESAS